MSRNACDWLQQLGKITGAMGLQEMMRDFENQEQQDGDEDEADQVLSCKISRRIQSSMFQKVRRFPPRSPTRQ